jgi:hypothetical protein
MLPRPFIDFDYSKYLNAHFGTILRCFDGNILPPVQEKMALLNLARKDTNSVISLLPSDLVNRLAQSYLDLENMNVGYKSLMFFQPRINKPLKMRFEEASEDMNKNAVEIWDGMKNIVVEADEALDDFLNKAQESFIRMFR